MTVINMHRFNFVKRGLCVGQSLRVPTFGAIVCLEMKSWCLLTTRRSASFFFFSPRGNLIDGGRGREERDSPICFPQLCLQGHTFQRRRHLWGVSGHLTKPHRRRRQAKERGSDCACDCQPACFCARVYISISLLAHLCVFCTRACVHTAQIWVMQRIRPNYSS